MSPSPSLLLRLAQMGVRFVIVGGYAGIAHGCSYTTQDIDICCEFSAENILALQQAIADLHPVHRMTPARKPLCLTTENTADLKNLYLDTDLGPLDCLSHVTGLGDYEQVHKCSEAIDAEGTELNILTIDALITAREAMNRPRDKEAIRQLKAIKELRRREP